MELCRIDLFLPSYRIRMKGNEPVSRGVVISAAESCVTRTAKGTHLRSPVLSQDPEKRKQVTLPPLHSSKQ